MWASYQTAGFENVICGSFASNAWPDLLRFGPTTHELLPLNSARPGNNGSLFSAAKRWRSMAMFGIVAAVCDRPRCCKALDRPHSLTPPPMAGSARRYAHPQICRSIHERWRKFMNPKGGRPGSLRELAMGDAVGCTYPEQPIRSRGKAEWTKRIESVIPANARDAILIAYHAALILATSQGNGG